MKTVTIVAAAAALLVAVLGLGIFAQDSGAQIAGRTPSILVMQRCKQDPSQLFNAEVYVSWYVQEPWDEAYVDTTARNDGFERGTFNGAPAGAPQPSDDARFPGFRGSVTVTAMGGYMDYLRVNLRYGTDWYPSPVLSFVVDPCTGGTVVAPAPPSGTAPSSDDLQRLESRVLKLENCLGRYPPYLCSSRLDDIEGRLDNLERGW